MKNILSVLGSTTAMMMVAFAAHAADASVSPELAPAPTSGVQICDAFGTGYFYIPGTETCMKIGGAVAFQVDYDSATDTTYAGPKAHLDVDTAMDSEFGTIGTKLRGTTTVNANGRMTDIELAYISIGPAYLGYKETLFNDNFGYGDWDGVFNGLGGLNTVTAGFLAKNVVGGLYVGGAIEEAGRNPFSSGALVTDSSNYDLIARIGYEDQTWGTADLSGEYSTDSDSWIIKATGDLKATDALGFRISAGYGQYDSSNNRYILSAASTYNFTDAVSAFGGVIYADGSIPGATTDGFAANIGASWIVAKDLDVTGQVTYFDKIDDYNTKLTITRKF